MPDVWLQFAVAQAAASCTPKHAPSVGAAVGDDVGATVGVELGAAVGEEDGAAEG